MNEKKINRLGEVAFSIAELTEDQLEAILAFIDFLKRRAGQ